MITMSASKLRLYWKLQLASHFMQKYADRELLNKAKITTAQTGVLAVIANRSDISQKDVAIALGLNESAVTAMAKRLVKLGYIETRKSHQDGRTKLLTLTEAGKMVQRQVKPPFRQINQQIEDVFDEKEISQLADYLQRLVKAFR